uniref:Uncharacterized protein n=1 Tax=Rhizophora mucronata TaxID=61149 RepID=A0A2P2L623_RHIMU
MRFCLDHCMLDTYLCPTRGKLFEMC